MLAAAGFEVLVTEHPVPTPVVAFGIRHLGCVAGVVVTASHNPPQDNGYKVYLGDGSQIVPPADAEIAARIDEVAAHPLADVARSDAYGPAGPHLLDAYAARAASLVPPDAPRELRWAYTPMHGVGGDLVLDLVARAGFPAPAVVAEQAAPDPDFPTVAFPNPEEPGAIDLALALGEQVDADVVVANDPDADRCAVAARFDVGLADADRRRARRPARRGRAAPRDRRHVRLLGRLQHPARRGRGRVRPAERDDADRVQVDRPRARAWPSATRRRSATASTPRPCATRTA